MSRKIQYRLLAIALVIVLSVSLLYFQKINLGLDLRGGVHMILQVEIEEAIEAEILQMRERIQIGLEEENLTFGETRVEDDRILIMGVPVDSQREVEEFLSVFQPSWPYSVRVEGGLTNFTVRLDAAHRKALANQSVRQARQIVARRIDEYGVAEPSITVYGSGDVQDQIIVELPGVEDFERVRQLIQSVAKLELKLVHPSHRGAPFPTREAAIASFDGAIPPEYEILPVRERDSVGAQTGYYVVRRTATITGQHLKNARRAQDPLSGRSEVSFFLNPEGVALFSQTTGQNVGNQLAIVLDDMVRSAPRIEGRIDTESARITGNFTPEEADDLALILRSGALPARLQILAYRPVGPSLGRDSIIRGVYASVIGLLLVVSGMLLFYRVAGINAVFCLGLNLLILMGILAYFRATLTLPGIAGIILTIGMAVDANILIFERIKEELRVGKTVRAAVDAGFERVFSTIIDTNITTLVAALFLFQFGTGPVRGFAVTLAVGLLANIFTATFVSRTLFSILLLKKERTLISI